MIVMYSSLKKESISLNQSKVKKQIIEPGNLELELLEFDCDTFELKLNIENYPSITIEKLFVRDGEEYEERDEILRNEREHKHQSIEEYGKHWNELVLELRDKGREEMFKAYQETLDRLKKCQYVLHIYGNGKIKVEFTSEP